jgi:hypothetical protein
MSDITQHQHYVWRHYLDAWSIKAKVWCYRKTDDKFFNPKPRNVAGERFFYGTSHLKRADIVYLNTILLSGIKNTMLRELAAGYINIFTLPDQFEKKLLPKMQTADQKAELSAVIDKLRKTAGEEYHGAIERSFHHLLAQSKAGDLSFLDDNEEAINFYHFIAHQYMRTGSMRRSIQAIESPVPGHDFKRTWLIESFVYATNLGFSLYARREAEPVTILRNSTSIPFVVGDQPVLNLLPPDGDKVDIYYPLSPNIALRISECANESRDLAASEVEDLNRIMFMRAEENLFANNEAYLRSLVSALRNSDNCPVAQST